MNDAEAVEKSIQYRGKILHAISDLEFLLNTFIALHYCGNDDEKAYEMQKVILGDDRINLYAKVQIFHFISIKHYNNWVIKYASIRLTQSKKNNNLYNDIVYCIEQRNIFAHRILDRDMLVDQNTYPLKKGYIRFAKFKNEITQIDYNDEAVNELYNLIAYVVRYLNDFIQNTLSSSKH